VIAWCLETTRVYRHYHRLTESSRRADLIRILPRGGMWPRLSG
jgi:hypothetical protein